ncbi:MAG: tripartite tricarboxylate transporter substrate binding protein [Alphaproteobacteria bacterium]|nr:tripartite tricarboxylate transporter substrate binding protein [Alphaproteobacteria bacterium]
MQKLLIALFSLALLPAAALAQAYPSRPITLVVPYPPGGTTDIVARLVAPKIAEQLGQSIVIENKGGAGGTIGAGFVTKSAPDGYTLLLGTPPDQVTAQFLTKQISYDPAKDFAPISLLVRGPNVLVVNPNVPAKTLAEFVALAKQQPGKLNFASAGKGNTSHLSGELFKVRAGIDITHVPYRGNAPASQDLLAGHVQALFEAPAASLGNIRDGRARPLAVTSAQRLKTLPDVPTFAEAGVQGVEVYTWFSILAPAKTPPEIIAQLNKATSAALADAGIRARLEEMSFEVVGGAPDVLGKFITVERVKWEKVIKDAGITAD